MKRFLYRVFYFLFLLFIILSIGILLPPTPRASTAHLFAQADKDILLQTVMPPRVILIGGSNVSMSINSQLLQDSLHINPVNMGLSASIGLLYMLDHSLPHIMNNDLVIVCPEYSQFYDKLYLGTDDLTRVILDTSPVDIFKLRTTQFLNSLRYFPRYALSKYKFTEYYQPESRSREQLYLRTSFNRHGDMVQHWEMDVREFESLPPTPHATFDDEVILYLTLYKNEIEKRGASLFVTFPALQEESFLHHFSEIRYIEQQLLNHHFKLLGTPDRYRMPDSLLFDTPYHLTRKGVELRTTLLIEDLRRVINRKK